MDGRSRERESSVRKRCAARLESLRLYVRVAVRARFHGVLLILVTLAACNKCLGGEWGCPDFKTGKDSATYECKCSKKASGTCKYNNYDGICTDPGYVAASGAIVPVSRLFSVGLAALSFGLVNTLR